MQFRGPTLLLFGASLILSPVAVHLANRATEQPATPAELNTVNAQRVSCERSSIETAIGRLGCHEGAADAERRRMDDSGALFVRARN